MFAKTAVAEKKTFRFGWLYGKRADICVFVVPIVVTALLCLGRDSNLAFAAVCLFLLAEGGSFLGNFHSGATWFHYFDRRNNKYYGSSRERAIAFFWIPSLIVVLCVIGFFSSFALVLFIYMVWTIQHLVQQNIGILLLYRNAASSDATVSRTFEARTLQISAAFTAAVYFYRYFGPHHRDLDFAAVLCAVLLDFAIAGLYVWNLARQVRSGASLNVPALGFWFVSMIMWTPLLIGPTDYFFALILPLTVHWCQYIGLNYFLVETKYQVSSHRDDLPLKSLSPIFLFVIVCSISMILMSSADKLTAHPVSLNTFLKALVIGFSMCHYYQDSVIWKFREAFARETILPYLLTRRC